MESVDFRILEFDHPSRLELLIRPIYFVAAYIMLNLVSVVIAVFALANFSSILFFGRRSERITKATSVAGAGYLARVLAYLWVGTDERPALAPHEGAYAVEYKWRYSEKASRVELAVRLVLVPVISIAAVVAVLIAGFVIGPIQAVFVLLFARRQRNLSRWTEQAARLVAEAYCYSFLVTDERPLFSSKY